LTATAGLGEALIAVIPSWRADLEIESDVAEEVARVLGYQKIPPILPHTAMPPYLDSPLGVRDLVRQTLAGAGLTEVVTAALIAPRQVEAFRSATPAGPALPGDDPAEGRTIRAVNALSSEHAVLRQQLLAGLLQVVALNLHQGREDVAIFEIGKGYGYDEASGLIREWWRLGFALTGASQPQKCKQRHQANADRQRRGAPDIGNLQRRRRNKTFFVGVFAGRPGDQQQERQRG